MRRIRQIDLYIPILSQTNLFAKLLFCINRHHKALKIRLCCRIRYLAFCTIDYKVNFVRDVCQTESSKKINEKISSALAPTFILQFLSITVMSEIFPKLCDFPVTTSVCIN